MFRTNNQKALTKPTPQVAPSASQPTKTSSTPKQPPVASELTTASSSSSRPFSPPLCPVARRRPFIPAPGWVDTCARVPRRPPPLPRNFGLSHTPSASATLPDRRVYNPPDQLWGKHRYVRGTPPITMSAKDWEFAYNAADSRVKDRDLAKWMRANGSMRSRVIKDIKKQLPAGYVDWDPIC